MIIPVFGDTVRFDWFGEIKEGRVLLIERPERGVLYVKIEVGEHQHWVPITKIIEKVGG